MSSSLLKLGYVDANASVSEQELNSYIRTFRVPGSKMEHYKLLDDDRSFKLKKRWVPPVRSQTNDEVVELTKFLEKAGFLPNAIHDGFFGYITQAAVRLFQEYVRTRDPDYDPNKKGQKKCFPDGMVGNGTRGHIARWKEAKMKADWGKDPKGEAAKNGKAWRKRFLKTAQHLTDHPGPIQKARKRFKSETDTLLPEDWKFPKDQPLLFGIRRLADIDNHLDVKKWSKKLKKMVTQKRRPMDDLFVLLVNGHSFVFFGSTDPSVHLSRAQEPYLVNGQHLYQFSWHLVSIKYKTYRAFRPAKHGVVVIRDTSKADSLSTVNVKKGPDKTANNTINIHWSGLGHSNFSAGCQVIAGNSYLDSEAALQSCRSFGAFFYDDLGKPPKQSNRRTKGAYNLLTDLIMVYGRNTPWSLCPPLRYTLFSASDLEAAGAMTKVELKAIRKKLK
ncbi:MAG: peptidoglycan-binding protein [Lewinella sp.]